MKLKITYREVTVALGILVALIVMITLWSAKPVEAQSRQTVALPSFSIPKASTQAIETALDVIF